MTASETQVKAQASAARTDLAVKETAGEAPAPSNSNPIVRRRPYWLFAIPATLAVALAALLWWMWPPTLHGIMLDQPRPTTDFTLPSSAGGAPMNLSDFRGQYVLLYFGYTYCPDVCPLTMNELAAMARELGERRMENVQVLFISVDPDRDTPDHLASYLPHFHPDFLGMTGTVREIQPVASQFGIFFQSHGGPGESGYLVDHTSSVTLIDPQGRVRMVFPYGVSGAEMAQDLQYLMRTSFRF